ncbi:MAG: helix-turn-helix domain-containing protein [Candidatus Bipolaricaulaceae bacterium]
MDQIGERLKQFRLQRGLSKRALAGRLGVSVPTVMRWEEGTAVPNDYNRHKIQQVLAEADDALPLFAPRRPKVVSLSLFDLSA